MEKKILVTIRLPKSFHDRIKEEAKKSGFTISQLVKMLLDQWLREREYYRKLNVPSE